MIRKFFTDSYENFYMSGKWPELLSSVTSCDLFLFFLVMRCDFLHLAMNCNELQLHIVHNYLFIGEFAIYQVFAQMKHNLNCDSFYLIKYPG